MIAGDQANPADVARVRDTLRLDPLYLIRFGEWSWRVVQGNLGTSIFSSHSIVSNDLSSLICQHKFSSLRDKCRRYTRRKFVVLNSQKNLSRLRSRRFRHLSGSIDWISAAGVVKTAVTTLVGCMFKYRQRSGARWSGRSMVLTCRRSHSATGMRPVGVGYLQVFG